MPIIHQTEGSKNKQRFTIRLKLVILGRCILTRIMIKNQSRIKVLRSWKNMQIILWAQVVLDILYMDRCIRQNKTNNSIMKRGSKILKKEGSISLENEKKWILESIEWCKLRLKVIFQTSPPKKNKKTQNNSKEANPPISALPNFPSKTTQSTTLYMKEN